MSSSVLVERLPSGRSIPHADDRADPRSSRAAGDRPSLWMRLLRLQDAEKRHDRFGVRDLHPCSPPPAHQLPAIRRGRERERKKNLSAGLLLSAH